MPQVQKIVVQTPPDGHVGTSIASIQTVSQDGHVGRTVATVAAGSALTITSEAGISIEQDAEGNYILKIG
jgi:hypothetical protein